MYSRELNREITKNYDTLMDRATNIGGADGAELLSETLLTIKLDTLEQVAAKGTLVSYVARAMKLNYRSSTSRWHYKFRKPNLDLYANQSGIHTEDEYRAEYDTDAETWESDMLDTLRDALESLNPLERRCIEYKLNGKSIRTIAGYEGYSQGFIEQTINIAEDIINERIK